MKVLIVSGGEPDKEIVRNCRQEKYEAIIAVDRGIEILDELNIVPTHIIGDFDSVNKNILEKYIDLQIHKLNSNKDYTDTNMAIKLAIDLKADEVVIVCATGKRKDHEISNIQDMVLCLNENIVCKIVDENNEIFLVNKNTNIKKDEKYKYVSLIPLTNEVTGIALKGFKYPLENHTLKIGENIGISNEQIEDEAKIVLKTGILIVIKSED